MHKTAFKLYFNYFDDEIVIQRECVENFIERSYCSHLFYLIVFSIRKSSS